MLTHPQQSANGPLASLLPAASPQLYKSEEESWGRDDEEMSDFLDASIDAIVFAQNHIADELGTDDAQVVRSPRMHVSPPPVRMPKQLDPLPTRKRAERPQPRHVRPLNPKQERMIEDAMPVDEAVYQGDGDGGE